MIIDPGFNMVKDRAVVELPQGVVLQEIIDGLRGFFAEELELNVPRRCVQNDYRIDRLGRGGRGLAGLAVDRSGSRGGICRAERCFDAGAGMSALVPLPQPVSQQAAMRASTAKPSSNNRAACIIEASLQTSVVPTAESSAVYPFHATSIRPSGYSDASDADEPRKWANAAARSRHQRPIQSTLDRQSRSVLPAAADKRL